MARATVSLRSEGGRLLLVGVDSAAGSGGPLPLRLKPQVPQDALRVEDRPLPELKPGEGIDSGGKLVPYFHSTADWEAHGNGVKGMAHNDGGASPVPAATAGNNESAAAAKAAALAAPSRTRLVKASERAGPGSPRSSGGMGPLPRPAAAQAAATGDSMGMPSSTLYDQQDEEDGDEEEGPELQQQDKFDTQCALCDDGGDLLACDGPCMRSFHADPSGCNLLGLPTDLAKVLTMPNNNETFLCPNCLTGKHQCFVCKKEGQAGKEVFKCINASCGRHYHPACAGVEPNQPFICKLHRCKGCGEIGERGSKDWELVPCRRCPIAYHRRCLPDKLPKRREVKNGARVWLADYDAEKGVWLDGVEQSLLYCRKHELDPDTEQALFTVPVSGKPKQQVPYRLLHPDLHSEALLHYARQYRHLDSSRKLLAMEASKQLKRRQQQLQAAAAEAGEGSDSEEDVPLARKLALKRQRRPEGSLIRLQKGAKRQKQQQEQQRQKQKLPTQHRPGPVQQHQEVTPAAQPPAVPAASPVAALPAKPQPKQPTATPVKQAAAATAAPAAVALPPVVEAGDEIETRHEPEPSSLTQDAAGVELGDVDEVQQGLPAAAQVSPAAAQEAAVGDAAAAVLASDMQQGSAQPAAQRTSSERVDTDALEDALERVVHAPSKRRRRLRIKRLLQEAEEDPSLTKDVLWNRTRRPEPYRHAMKKTIDEAKLAELERSIDYALGQRLPERELMQLLDAPSVKSVLAHYDDLFMVLAPYLHGDRYSSYGRHFTSKRLLHRVAHRLATFLHSGDQVVDFSCGENYFVPYLKHYCLKQGMVLSGRCYDIIQAKDDTDFVLKSWFDTMPQIEGLNHPDHLCICLNPPFGKNNSLADKFVLHAAKFSPRIIALIVPPRTVIPRDYTVVLENNKMCGGEEFYVPGSTHRSWNKEWPVLRVLMRKHGQWNMFGDMQVVFNCTAEVHQQHQQHQQALAMAAGVPHGGAYGAMMPMQPHPQAPLQPYPMHHYAPQPRAPPHAPPAGRHPPGGWGPW